MKRTLKTIFLTSLAVILLLFILFVDTTFYHIPSFIKIYRVERELIICIAALILYFRLKYFIHHRKLTLKKILLTVYGLVISLFGVTLLPQLVLKRYLVLWDENPFLAEYPFVWNVVSEFCTVATISIFLMILILVKRLLDYRPNRYSNFEYRILSLTILGAALIFNILEDRYTYDRFALLQHANSASIWIIGGALIIITLVISIYKSWIDVLNKREKYTGFLLSLSIIPVSLYLMFSNLLFPVFVFSMTVKGFVLALLVFTNVYALSVFIGFLFRLPTASVYDRVTMEIQSISQISKMISESANIEAVFQTIVKHACRLTSSDACWLSFGEQVPRASGMEASVHLSEYEKSQLARMNVDCIGDLVRQSQEALLIHNLDEDERTASFHTLSLKWRSMIAVPLLKDDQVVGVLYSVKKPIYAYDETDLHTLKSFAVQINIALSASPLIRKLESSEGESAGTERVKKVVIDSYELFFMIDQDSYADRISLPDRQNLFFQITSIDCSPEDRVEIRGVLKTLFTMEPEPAAAYAKACQMVSKEHSGARLTVLMPDPTEERILLFSGEPYRVRRIYSGHDRVRMEDVDRGGSSAATQHDDTALVLRLKSGRLLIGSSRLLEPLDQRWLDDLVDREPELDTIDLLKKINPESRLGSGVLFCVMIKG